MNQSFTISVENSPDITGSVVPEVTRFDVYVCGDHSSHTDQEHTGFWGQIELPEPLPPMFDLMITCPADLGLLRKLSEPAYWYATGLIDAAEIMDDFDIQGDCEGCEQLAAARLARATETNND